MPAQHPASLEFPGEARATLTALVPRTTPGHGLSGRNLQRGALRRKPRCCSASQMFVQKSFMPLAQEKPRTLPRDRSWGGLRLLPSSIAQHQALSQLQRETRALGHAHSSASYFNLESRQAKQHWPNRSDLLRVICNFHSRSRIQASQSQIMKTRHTKKKKIECPPAFPLAFHSTISSRENIVTGGSQILHREGNPPERASPPPLAPCCSQSISML